MRIWLRQLDESVHVATGVISLCIAFRLQHLKRDPDELRKWLAALDPARQERTKAAIDQGIRAPQFAPAVRRFGTLAKDIDAALTSDPWLAGGTFSLADIAYAPYMARLAHLGLDDAFASRPRVQAWLDRLFERRSYQSAIQAWFSPSYLEIFATQMRRRERPLKQF